MFPTPKALAETQSASEQPRPLLRRGTLETTNTESNTLIVAGKLRVPLPMPPDNSAFAGESTVLGDSADGTWKVPASFFGTLIHRSSK